MSSSSNRAAIPNSDGVYAFANPRYVSPSKKPSCLTNRRFTAYQQERETSSSRLPNSKLKRILDDSHQEGLFLDRIANGKNDGPIPKKYKGGKWSEKYKRSIDCKRPKGFSQKQHCKYGRKTRKQR